MTDITQSNGLQARHDKPPVYLAVIAILWIAAVLTAAGLGFFELTTLTLPLPILAAVALPVAVFAASLAVSPATRRWLLALDPALITDLQAWRILGGMFLALYAFGQLPGLFAWPAGLGDVAVGVAAPFVVWALRRDPDFLASGRFRLFHYLGLFDFVLAVSTGIMAREAIPGLVGTVTSAPMGQLPLVLIPAIGVPSFIMLHIVALMQSAAARR